ncbi:hypothetical protein [Saccharibacillus kuerlensis]|uniref:Uncharacterized protein n=1 Tax=Saccharibacillus kuerlensis TaxID=459527 RepID=A0ABQ2L4M0_9BACL|nr:hypothetical protein [Saccharibacillus kuerlensis]GGO02983.1 hypothetical protein GCM10010969_26840 [Saccharibacillus kuerlensis]
MNELFWVIVIELVKLGVLAGVIYAIVSSVVESRINRLVRVELDHMDRKQNDRFQVLDRHLQELNTVVAEQGQRLKRVEASLEQPNEGAPGSVQVKKD